VFVKTSFLRNEVPSYVFFIIIEYKKHYFCYSFWHYCNTK